MKLHEIYGIPYGGAAAPDQVNPKIQYFPDNGQATKYLYARRALTQAFKDPKLVKLVNNCTTSDQMLMLVNDVLDTLPETANLKPAEKDEVAEQYVRAYYRNR